MTSRRSFLIIKKRGEKSIPSCATSSLIKNMIKEVLANQDARKEEVSSKLKEFQKEQQEMAKRLKALLAKGRSLRIKDLKETLQEFRTQHKERLSRQIERKKDVNKMLGTFKQERKESGKNLWIRQVVETLNKK